MRLIFNFLASILWVVPCFGMQQKKVTCEDTAKIIHGIQERETKKHEEMVSHYCAGNFEPRQLFQDVLVDEYVPLFSYLLEKKILDPNYSWKNSLEYDEARILHACVCHKKYQQTELFLRNGAQVNVTANPGTPNFFGHSYYPIFYAIQEQDCKMVELLGKYDADLNLYSLNIRPLAYAVYLYGTRLDNEKLVKSFGGNQSDLAWADAGKKTAFEVIKMLVAKWANPFAASLKQDGKTSFALAQEKGADELVNLFLSAPQALKILCTQKAAAPLLQEVLQKKMINPDTSWQEGGTSATSVFYLLTTALHHKAHENARLLIENGANCNNAGVFDIGCAARWSPLAIAAHNGNPEVVDLLLKHNADPNLPKFPSPLGQAINSFDPSKESSYHIIQQLLDAGAHYDLTNKDDILLPKDERLIKMLNANNTLN